MAGLLTMDLCTIFKKKIFILIMIVMGWLLGVMGANTFVVGYLTMLGSMLVITTLNYDSMNNGLSFLFTLPIDVKSYVFEKYILGFFFGVMSWVAGMFFLFLGCVLKGQTMGEMGQFFILIPTSLIMISVMIPLEIKFGAEKSRIALMVGVGVCFLIIYFAEKVFDASSNIAAVLDNMSEGTFMAGVFVVCIVITIVSISRSISFLANKEL